MKKAVKKRIWMSGIGNEGMQNFYRFDFDVKTNPNINFIADKLETDVDCILFCDDHKGGYDDYSDQIGTYSKFIPSYGIKRIDKHQQTIMLRNAGINIPETYFSKSIQETNFLIGLLYDIQDDEQLVIKITAGARGLGQALLTKRQLIALYEMERFEITQLSDGLCSKDEPMTAHTTDIDVLVIEKKPIPDELKTIKFSNGSIHELLSSALTARKDCSFLIQRYIPNRIEWRLLWFHNDDHIYVKRHMDKDSWQANACNNSKDSSVVINGGGTDIGLMDEYNKYVDMQVIDDFCKALKVPHLSIDVYYDCDKRKWGIFEFQMEFGWTKTAGLDSRRLHFNINDSLKKLIDGK